MGSPEKPNAYQPVDEQAVQNAIDRSESDRDGTRLREVLERFGEENGSGALLKVMLYATGQEVRYDSLSQVRDVPASSLVVAGFALAYEMLRPGPQPAEQSLDNPTPQPPNQPPEMPV